MKIRFIHITIIGLMMNVTQTYAMPDFFKSKDSSFKRFSLSAGWLYAEPQGNRNSFNNSTAIKEGTVSAVGDVQIQSVIDAVDTSTIEGQKVKDNLIRLRDEAGLTELPSILSGDARLFQLSNWTSANSGLKPDTVNTLGIMFNYHINDNVSLELKAGIPPKVDIQGFGQINAPLNGSAVLPAGVDEIIGSPTIPLSKQIPITDLSQGGKAAEARAWLPAVEVHYQFGKSGVNKFRPYIGAGIMYAYFNNLKMNGGIEQDLIRAGHMVQNIRNGQAAAALEGKTSTAKPFVKLETTDAIAPIATIGFTYDFTPNWFTVASISYAKLNNKAKVYVNDSNTGDNLIYSSAKIDIDPIISYAGIGYRF
ncbi:OmpW/AlkL family protein [Acinetobacter haemolyticus]|uniref:OmpW/AlkL family protein n=1 Tax=Acinetobacter haemolyticus TaxID=29430 RepID=UPI00370979BD|nr:OmpW family protein [Acinetobacter haemolyticus]